MPEFTRRRALLFGGAGLAALTAGGTWLATRGGASAATWHHPATPSGSPIAENASASTTVPGQPGAPGAERADLLTAANADGLVKIRTAGWYNWALLDQATGEIVGSDNMHETNMTASMIKAWLAADYLRLSAERGRTPGSGRMAEIKGMIRDSDNDPASVLWDELGGADTVSRMISVCGLTDSRAGDNWSVTRLSARDTCRLAHAIGTGAAAGPTWTKYLLGEMRAVRGEGDFGIRKAFPAADRPGIAIKNGWVTRTATKEWNVNCLALGDGWTMAVLTRYPEGQHRSHGENIAQSVATQLRTLTRLV